MPSVDLYEEEPRTEVSPQNPALVDTVENTGPPPTRIRRLKQAVQEQPEGRKLFLVVAMVMMICLIALWVWLRQSSPVAPKVAPAPSTLPAEPIVLPPPAPAPVTPVAPEQEEVPPVRVKRQASPPANEGGGLQREPDRPR
jgi:hypothetical protein